MKEIWRDIKGYEGLYQVSNLGKVKSLEKIQIFPNGGKVVREEKILKTNKTYNGYLNVRLYKNKKVKGFGVHRLVAQEFIDNPKNLPQVNHINCNKTDNKINNLEWCDASYNQNHAIKSGRVKVHKVIQYDLNKNFIKEWDSIKEIAKYYNKSYSSIISCCLGETKTSNNFIWRYKEEY